MKKVLSLILAVAMLICIISGCVAEPAPTTTAPEESFTVADPQAAGMLVFNANAVAEISYDSEGLVLSAEGLDENGAAAVKALGEVLGESCSKVITGLMQHCIDTGFVTKDLKTAVIKMALGSAAPGESFLENLAAEAQKLTDSLSVIAIGTDALDANGYINFEKATELLTTHLGLSGDVKISGPAEPVEEAYSFTLKTDLVTEYYSVNANTGAVSIASEAADPDFDENTDETAFDPNAQETVQETVQENIPEDTVEIPEETEIPETIPEDI